MSKKTKPTKKPSIAQLNATINDLQAKIKTLTELTTQRPQRRTAPLPPLSGYQQRMMNCADMFDDLANAQLHPSTREFIDSLQAGLAQYGSLTSAQYAALYRNWNWFHNGVPFDTPQNRPHSLRGYSRHNLNTDDHNYDDVPY